MPLLGSAQDRLVNKARGSTTLLDGLVHIYIGVGV
jgi:hypothetical protein